MSAVLKKQSHKISAGHSPAADKKARRMVPAEIPFAIAITKDSGITWRSLAAEVFEECGGDREKSIECMQQMLVPGSVLFEQLVSPLIAQAVESVMRSVKRDHNASSWKGRVQQIRTGDRLESLAASLLYIRLPNNVVLRDARASDLKHAAHFNRSQANTMASRARFYDLIAERIGTKTVAQVFGDDDAELRRLQKKAEV